LRGLWIKLAHLGIEAPARASLSYANIHRPWELFEKVFHGLFEKVAAKGVGRKKFRFKNKLVSLDSTVIDLCLSAFDWAKWGAGVVACDRVFCRCLRVTYSGQRTKLEAPNDARIEPRLTAPIAGSISKPPQTPAVAIRIILRIVRCAAGRSSFTLRRERTVNSSHSLPSAMATVDRHARRKRTRIHFSTR
jgi:hypothetical protein